MKSNFKYYLDLVGYKNSDHTHYIFFKGWCFHSSSKKVEYTLRINDLVFTNFKYHNRLDLVNVFPNETDGIDVGFSIKVNDIPKNIDSVELFAEAANESVKIVRLGKKDLDSLIQKTSISYSLDLYEAEGPNHPMNIIAGWAYSLSGDVEYSIIDEDSNPVDIALQLTKRMDLVKSDIVPKDKAICGFHISYKGDNNKKYFLKISVKDEVEKIEICKKNLSSYRSVSSIISQINLSNIKKAIEYTQRKGLKNLVKKVLGNSDDSISKEITYNEWAKKRDLTLDEIKKQKEILFTLNPKMSLIVATFNTPTQFLKEMIDTVVDQTYTNWELCIADGSTDNQVLDYVNNNYQNENRIKIKKLDKNYGISGNMNVAIDMATGDFIGLYDHDDTLTPDALFEFVKAYNMNPELEVIYSDEDKINSEGTVRFEPHFKSDFNIDLLCTNNYICHLLFVKTSLINKVGKLRSEYDGAQDHDFILRCVENLDENKIHHIPRVLYHWRIHQNSTAGNPESKLYAFDAGVRASQDYFDRKGIKAKVEHGETLGFYRVRYIVEREPLVSILIPNKDHVDDLNRCLTSIYDKTTYKNFEIIVIENNSENDETFEYYESIEKQHNNLKVVFWKNEFNYSAINNFGATFSRGEYLLLLNNDTEVINPDWLSEMVGYGMRKDVGIVGAKLYYEDDTIQHAGVIIGLGGIAGHCFVNYPRDAYGYFGHLICAKDYSAVTAACMLVKRKVFDAVNGLDETLKVAFNDIDFCLKVRKLGYLVVFNPYVELYHYESKSRGLENSVEKVERFSQEIEFFRNKWNDILENGDPYYNPNLTLVKSDYSLK